MNAIFHTLGCKVNQYETEAVREAFINKGYTNDTNLPADIVVINSCTVTAESDRKTRQLLRRCRRDFPNAVIILTGCMVQAFPERSDALSEADIIIGNKNTSEIINAAERFLNEKKRFVLHEDHNAGDAYTTPSICDFSERTRAFMKIEDGCDRFCSYCIIPKARGRVRSRAISDIKSEAIRLADKGYSELVLVGINLSAYGKGENFNICDAVDAVCSVDGILRVRLGSLEPDHITNEMLERLKNQEKFCPQFHLSLQSGCDETLKRMNRHYDSAFYFDLVNRIRSTFENSSVTTDIMVGFAGETNEEFEKSLDFVKRVNFARAHIFVYSRREGTVAAALDCQVQKSVAERRAKLMSAAASQSESDFLKTQVGKTVPVLFETPENGLAVGYTPNYSRITVKTDEPLTGKIKSVKIISAEDDHCIGTIV